MSNQTHTQSTPELISSLLREGIGLIRDEVQLARAELSEKFDQAKAGIAAVIAGAILFIAALNVLLGAVVAGLMAAGLSAGWAAVVVGGLTFIVAVALVMMGMSRLEPSALTPDRTIRQVSTDAERLKETLS